MHWRTVATPHTRRQKNDTAPQIQAFAQYIEHLVARNSSQKRNQIQASGSQVAQFSGIVYVYLKLRHLFYEKYV